MTASITTIRIVLALFCAFAVGRGQEPRPCCPERDQVLIAKDKASISITFERTEESSKEKPPFDTRMKGSSLRLNNNTRWAIRVPTERLYVGSKIIALRLCDGRSILGLRNGIDVAVQYEVESHSGASVWTLPFPGRTDVSWTSWIPAGGSILFKVNPEHLANNLKVYVPYHYEWETGERVNDAVEPKHRVYLQAGDSRSRGN